MPVYTILSSSLALGETGHETGVLPTLSWMNDD